MKQQPPYRKDRTFGLTIVKFGSTSERLRIIIFPANEEWITTFRECRYPFEKVLPDISSLSAGDAKLIGLQKAIYHMHESDPERAWKFHQGEGQMNLMLCELAREEWEEGALPR